jgi:hypothetical protein
MAALRSALSVFPSAIDRVRLLITFGGCRTLSWLNSPLAGALYATPDGESHFDEVELPTTKRSVHPDAVPFEITAGYPASRVRITRIPAGMREVAWHRVPDSVLTVRLDGSVEYESSDGEVRHVQAGSFVLVVDTHGKGHLSRHSAEAQTVIWIPHVALPAEINNRASG